MGCFNFAKSEVKVEKWPKELKINWTRKLTKINTKNRKMYLLGLFDLIPPFLSLSMALFYTYTYLICKVHDTHISARNTLVQIFLLRNTSPNDLPRLNILFLYFENQIAIIHTKKMVSQCLLISCKEYSRFWTWKSLISTKQVMRLSRNKWFVLIRRLVIEEYTI